MVVARALLETSNGSQTAMARWRSVSDRNFVISRPRSRSPAYIRYTPPCWQMRRMRRVHLEIVNTFLICEDE